MGYNFMRRLIAFVAPFFIAPFFIAPLFIALGVSILPAHAQVEQLKVTLSPLAPVIQGDADIVLRVIISNPNAKAVTVPVWQIPQDDIPTPILQITGPDGRAVPYTGPMVKWSAEALKNGVTFAPKSSRVFMIELSSLYDIGNGRYRIDYSQDGPGKYDQTGRSARVFGPIAPAFIETRGRSKGTSGALTPNATVTASSLTTTRCTTSQKTSIATAITNATTYSTDASNYLKATYTDTALRLRYTTWFGNYDSGRWSTVTSHFDSIYNAFNSAAITVDCSCKKNTVYAYVYPTKPYIIYVCGAFWSAPATGTDSKAGTLIHEMSHFNVVASTDDWAYGQRNAAALAISDTTKAIDNADSHEYFAENKPAQN